MSSTRTGKSPIPGLYAGGEASGGGGARASGRECVNGLYRGEHAARTT